MNKIITLQKCEVYADDEIVKKNFYFFFIFLKHFSIFDWFSFLLFQLEKLGLMGKQVPKTGYPTHHYHEISTR